MKKLLIILIILLTGCSTEHKKVTPDEVYKNIDNSNVVILDVRTYEEYINGHIENSKNIPIDEINSIDYSKNTIIYVYCQSGNRSKKASQILYDLGYTNVYDMGGIVNWQYELEKEG